MYRGVNNIMADIKRRFDHEAAKQILKEKYEGRMLFAEFGGMWKAGPSLISTLNSNNSEIMYLEDEYGNPCKVPRHKMLSLVNERWQEQMNAWFYEFEEMQKQR